jgi:hypothetical protein
MLKRTLSKLGFADEPTSEPSAKKTYVCKHKKLILDEATLANDFSPEEIVLIIDSMSCLNALFDPTSSNETVKRPSLKFESANASRKRGISAFFSSQTPIVVSVDRLASIRADFPPKTDLLMTHAITDSRHQLIFTVYFK